MDRMAPGLEVHRVDGRRSGRVVCGASLRCDKEVPQSLMSSYRMEDPVSKEDCHAQGAGD